MIYSVCPCGTRKAVVTHEYNDCGDSNIKLDFQKLPNSTPPPPPRHIDKVFHDHLFIYLTFLTKILAGLVLCYIIQPQIIAMALVEPAVDKFQQMLQIIVALPYNIVQHPDGVALMYLCTIVTVFWKLLNVLVRALRG